MRDAEQSSRYQGDLPDCGNQFEGSKAKCCRVSSCNLTLQNKEKHFKSIYYLRKIGGTIASLLFPVLGESLTCNRRDHYIPQLVMYCILLQVTTFHLL